MPSEAGSAALLSTGEKARTMTHKAALETEIADTTDAYAAGVRSGELALDPLALARFVAARVVAFGRHFLLIEKPSNFSVWGHARPASSHFTVCASFLPHSLPGSNDYGLLDRALILKISI